MINPFGGAGAAARNFETIAGPLLTYAHMDITVRFTERALHARDIVATELGPGDFDSIITVSGDGLIHEVVNGLCLRADWKEFKETISIGFIPGGTGNGLCKSVLFTSKEEYGV